MNFKSLSKKQVYYIGISLILLFFFILAYGTPLNYDDWAWGGELGMKRLANFYKNYNGRYASNTLEIILTRLTLGRYLFMSICSTFFVTSIARISKNKKFLTLLLVLVLLLLMPANIFKQTFAWLAGYTVYLPGTLLMIWTLIFLKEMLIDERSGNVPCMCRIGSNRIIRLPILFILFVLAELFVENISILMIAATGIVLLVAILKRREFVPETLTMLFGSILGNFIMFSNGAYQGYTNGENYKQVNLSGGPGSLLVNCWTGYRDVVANIAICRNFVLIIALSLISLYLLTQTGVNTWRRRILYIIVTIYTCLILLDHLMLTTYPEPLRNTTFMALASTVYMLAVLAIAILTTARLEKKILYALLALLWGVAIGPPLLTTPCHDRSLFFAYILLVIFAVCMFEECEIKETQSTKLLKGLTCFAACMMLVMSFMFVRNRVVFDEKIEYAQAHSDSEWLLLPNLPYPDYVYKGSQGRITEIFDREFKIYYGIDADTFISLAPYQQWKEFVYPSPDKSKDSEK